MELTKTQNLNKLDLPNRVILHLPLFLDTDEPKRCSISFDRGIFRVLLDRN